MAEPDGSVREGYGPGSSQVTWKDGLEGGVVPTCYWYDCDEPSAAVHKLGLVPPGGTIARPVSVPLCTKHKDVANVTGRVHLAMHPDDILNQ